MLSFNHYAYGAVVDWMYRHVAGIAPAAPGYRSLPVRTASGGRPGPRRSQRRDAVRARVDRLGARAGRAPRRPGHPGRHERRPSTSRSAPTRSSLATDARWLPRHRSGRHHLLVEPRIVAHGERRDRCRRSAGDAGARRAIKRGSAQPRTRTATSRRVATFGALAVDFAPTPSVPAAPPTIVRGPVIPRIQVVPMKVGVAKETAPGERRVALVPEALGKLQAAGLRDPRRSRRRRRLRASPTAPTRTPARRRPDRRSSTQQSDVVLRVAKPSARRGRRSCARARPSSGFLAPLIDPALAKDARRRRA